jgi:hypothetical protein
VDPDGGAWVRRRWCLHLRTVRTMIQRAGLPLLLGEGGGVLEARDSDVVGFTLNQLGDRSRGRPCRNRRPRPGWSRSASIDGPLAVLRGMFDTGARAATGSKP